MPLFVYVIEGVDKNGLFIKKGKSSMEGKER